MRALSGISETIRCPDHTSRRNTDPTKHTSDATKIRQFAGHLVQESLIMPDSAPQQLLHLVIGGELVDLDHVTFKDLDKLDIVGVYPNYATAYTAWKAKAQQTVDNAQMRYFIVHLHRLLDPDQDAKRSR
jgi:hypothetical protein